MKRAVYVLLTIILVAVTMFSALADNDEYIAVSDDEMKIKNETEFVSALEMGANLKLAKNVSITLVDVLSINGVESSIDLNGWTLSCDCETITSETFIVVCGKLTVLDSSDTKEGKIVSERQMAIECSEGTIDLSDCSILGKSGITAYKGTCSLNNINVNATGDTIDDCAFDIKDSAIDSISNCKFNAKAGNALMTEGNTSIGSIENCTFYSKGETVIVVGKSSSEAFDNREKWTVNRITGCTIVSNSESDGKSAMKVMNGGTVHYLEDCEISGPVALTISSRTKQYSGIGEISGTKLISTSEEALILSTTGKNNLAYARIITAELEGANPTYSVRENSSLELGGCSKLTYVGLNEKTIKTEYAQNGAKPKYPETTVQEQKIGWSLSKNGEPIDSATFTVSGDSTLFQIVMPASAINGANFSSLNEALEAAKSVENAELTLKDDVSCSDIDLTALRAFDLNGHTLTITDGAEIVMNPGFTFSDSSEEKTGSVSLAGSANGVLKFEIPEGNEPGDYCVIGAESTYSDGAFRFAITELSNFDIKLNPTATFTAENGTVDGEHASITLYAKYGAADLYTDRARTTAAALVPQPATGYTLSAKHWTSGEITFTDFAEIAALTPTENAIYTLNTELAKYNVSQMENNDAVATITFTSGVTEGKAVYGTPVSFSVTPAESQIVKSVTYNVSNGADVTVDPQNGAYSIPGAQITGDITIRAVTDEYVTIIFRSGAGASIGGEVTAYAIKGSTALYSGHNDTALDGSFTVPTVTPAERYRVDNDTVWTDGTNDYRTSQLGDSVTFSADTILTPRAIKTWLVSFAHDGSAAGESVTITVDNGYTLKSADVPAFTPNPGYEFANWTPAAPEEMTVISDLSFTAMYNCASYAVTTSGSADVTFISGVKVETL